MDDRRGSGLAKPLKLSSELKELLGTNKTEMPRMQVVNALYEYIKKNNLQDPNQRQYFTPDQKMEPIFGAEPVRTFGMSRFLKGHLGDPSGPVKAGTAAAVTKMNKVSVGQEEGISEYEKMRRANINEMQVQYARIFPMAVDRESVKSSDEVVEISSDEDVEIQEPATVKKVGQTEEIGCSINQNGLTVNEAKGGERKRSQLRMQKKPMEESEEDSSSDDDLEQNQEKMAALLKKKKLLAEQSKTNPVSDSDVEDDDEKDVLTKNWDQLVKKQRKKPDVLESNSDDDDDVPLSKRKKIKATKTIDKDLIKKSQEETQQGSQLWLWEGFIIFSQFKAADNHGYTHHGWNFLEMRSWNPYTANIKQVSMFLQILKRRRRLSDKDVEIYLNKILYYLPDLKGKELPELLQVAGDVHLLLNLIHKEKPLGHYKYIDSLKRYNGDIWTKFVIFYGNQVKEDPFLAEPHHVKDFIMEIFEEPGLPSLFLQNYPDFYCGNVVNICKNLGFYLKFEYEEKSLLDTKPIKDILDIFHSLDQKLIEPAGTNPCGKTDFKNMIPKYWYVNYNAKLQSKGFWRRGLVRNILLDVKNKVLNEGEAAWELGVTIDMISCQVQKMKPDQKFMSLTVNQYVEQGFGSEDEFWNEASTKMLLDDLRNQVIDVDTAAFQLGTSSAVVIKKAGRIKTWLEIEEEKHKMRLEKMGNAPPKLSPLELQVEIAEKNEDSLSDYEKMRLANMKERLSLFNSLDISKDKKSLGSGKTVRPFIKAVVEPRKKSSRVKTLLEKKESLKVEEESFYEDQERQSPLWVGTRTPKITVDPIDIDTHLCWELMDKSGNQISQDELSAIIPVPKLPIAATELIASELDYHKGTRFLHRLESEIEIRGSEEKLSRDFNIGNLIHFGGCKGSNDEIISMDMSEELIAFGDMGGGLGFWLGEKHLLLRPHNMPVCRTIFMGSGSSTCVVTASYDGTIRIFDASKQEFSLAYSWNKRYKYKQGVVWLEPVNENIWLVNCEEGDLLNLDRRDRKVNKILSLPNSRRSCQSKIMISREEEAKLSKYKYGQTRPQVIDETFFATPALVGSNIAIHPIDQNLISLCDHETVLVYDRRNFQKPMSTISTSSTFDSSVRNSSLSHHCGSSWSQSGKHFVSCERIGITHTHKQNLTLEGSINMYSQAQLTDNEFGIVPKKMQKYKNTKSQMFTSGPGVVWSPWQEEVCYYMANHAYKKHGMVIGVDVKSGDVVGELGLPTPVSNMMGFHPTRPQIVVANLNEAGDVVIYREA